VEADGVSPPAGAEDAPTTAEEEAAANKKRKEEEDAKAAEVKAEADAAAAAIATATAEALESAKVAAMESSPVKVSGWRKLVDMFAPESDGFYTKQAFAELLEVMSQSYRAWLLLVIAMSGRFGAADGAGNYIVLGAFVGVLLLHALFSITVIAGSCSPSPYANVKVDLVFDQLYIVGGLIASIFLWTDGKGLVRTQAMLPLRVLPRPSLTDCL